MFGGTGADGFSAVRALKLRAMSLLAGEAVPSVPKARCA
jgi:hypothetical protein